MSLQGEYKWLALFPPGSFTDLLPQYGRTECLMQAANQNAMQGVVAVAKMLTPLKEKAALVAGWFITGVYNKEIQSTFRHLVHLAQDPSPSPIQWTEPFGDGSEAPYAIEEIEALWEEHVKHEAEWAGKFNGDVNQLENEKCVKEKVAIAISAIAQFEEAQKRLHASQNRLEELSVAHVKADREIAQLTEEIAKEQTQLLTLLQGHGSSGH